MGGAKSVVSAFGALGEAGQAAALTQGVDFVPAPGENFMWISLVTNVPDDLVTGRVEHVVQRYREFDDAESRSEMAPRYRDGTDCLGAQFIDNLLQVRFLKPPQVIGFIDTIQHSGFRHV